MLKRRILIDFKIVKQRVIQNNSNSWRLKWTAFSEREGGRRAEEASQLSQNNDRSLINKSPLLTKSPPSKWQLPLNLAQHEANKPLFQIHLSATVRYFVWIG